jgi:hypothetical protein
LVEIARTFDGTRLVSSNDGWEQTRTDIFGIHFYAVEGDSLSKIFANKEQLVSAAASDRMIYAEGYHYCGEPVLLTEFRGIAFKNENMDHGVIIILPILKRSFLSDLEAYLKRFAILDI